jgi:hypothetical protein
MSMNGTRFVLLCVMIALPLMAACKSDPTFASEHGSELTYDCQETWACLSTHGQTSTASDPVKKCRKDAAALMNKSSGAEQMLFESTFARCQSFQGCEYVNCTQADGSYSVGHTAQITQHCRQSVFCDIMRGKSVAITATDACVAQLSTLLDMATDASKNEFDARFSRCGAMQACAYVDCK